MVGTQGRAIERLGSRRGCQGEVDLTQCAHKADFIPHSGSASLDSRPIDDEDQRVRSIYKSFLAWAAPRSAVRSRHVDWQDSSIS